MNLLIVFYLLAAFLCILGASQGIPVLVYLTKPLCLILLMLASIMNREKLSQFFPTFFLALFFSLLGDIFLMLPGDVFIPGLLAFLTAHVFFIVCFFGLDKEEPAVINLVFLIGYAALVVPRVLAASGSLKVPVFAYMLCLLAMAQVASSRASSRKRGSGMLVWGAWLFVLSDSLLGWDKFVGTIPFRDVLVLGSYFLAQLLLFLGFRNRMS